MEVLGQARRLLQPQHRKWLQLRRKWLRARCAVSAFRVAATARRHRHCRRASLAAVVGAAHWLSRDRVHIATADPVQGKHACRWIAILLYEKLFCHSRRYAFNGVVTGPVASLECRV
jgi:hypothetical protein